MGKLSRMGHALYEGHTSIDFVGRKWLWYAISGLIVLLAVVGLSTRGLNLGIEFKGGNSYTVSNLAPSQVNQAEVQRISAAVVGTGIPGTGNPVVTTAGTNSIDIKTESLTDNQATAVIAAIANTVHQSPQNISTQEVGASWGHEVASRALTGLIVFLVLVVLFIWAYFREWKMSVAALVALMHDLVITVGVYALIGFEVTPATVTAVLTILGYSLYDTVVVFDKVRENTKNLRKSRTTYAKAANLAVNQTLVRSINTTVMALIPVGAILVVGVATLGSGSLKDLALALFIGMLAGAYSSIFIATPLLVQLKSNEKQVTEAEARERARARRADRYAEVPVFDESMPIADDPDTAPARGQAVVRPTGESDGTPFEAPPRRPEAQGSGRTLPSTKAPMGESKSAKRQQPSRKPRSQR